MMVTFWVVWYSRNKLVYEGILPSVSESLSFTQAFIRESGSPNPLTDVKPRSCRSTWSAPALNVIKCNFDSTFDVQGHHLPRFWNEEAPPGATSAVALDWKKSNAD
ncbi:hypothetical protein V6N12_060899 [Hibiscus sabdariffa]|uniref:Uncharacterized protein n=1 Tax=Hibiscus sabdariffa TaxID=183260 RepID=A0ABR2DX61_9ROSI